MFFATERLIRNSKPAPQSIPRTRWKHFFFL